MRAEGEMRNSWASVNVGKTEFWLVRPEKHEKRDLAYSAFVVKDQKNRRRIEEERGEVSSRSKNGC